MGRTRQAPPQNWPEYMRWASKRAGYDLDERGGISRLERAIGVSTGQVTRWLQGRVPDPDSLRKLAGVWKRPMLEIYVATGNLTPDEARWQDRPAAPDPETPSEDAARVQRLQSVLDNPDTPETVRDRLRALLDIADDQARAAQRGA